MPRSPRRGTLAALLVLVPCALTACGDAAPLAAPDAASSPSVVAAVQVDPAVLAGLADAEARMVPALDAELRGAMASALAELRRTLDAGARPEARRALGAVRALLDGHAEDADAADVGAIAMLADLAADALGEAGAER